jgi:hypothetical protein
LCLRGIVSVSVSSSAACRCSSGFTFSGNQSWCLHPATATSAYFSCGSFSDSDYSGCACSAVSTSSTRDQRLGSSSACQQHASRQQLSGMRSAPRQYFSLLQHVPRQQLGAMQQLLFNSSGSNSATCASAATQRRALLLFLFSPFCFLFCFRSLLSCSAI